jgi:hypothetical protein
LATGRYESVDLIRWVLDHRGEAEALVQAAASCG